MISESKETSYFPNLTSIPSKPYECSEAVYNSNASNVSKFLHSSEWLSDLEINSYQFLLANHSQNLKYDGFQDVVQITPENPVGGTCARKFIQIVNINKCHWITLSNVFSACDHEINVYDSLPLRKSKLTSEPIFPYALIPLILLLLLLDECDLLLLSKYYIYTATSATKYTCTIYNRKVAQARFCMGRFSLLSCALPCLTHLL